MRLSAGTPLGSYEVLSPLGAGGMGEVYRARDTRLDRDVAIKILPEAFAVDSERVARFQREAKVLASLNHPHIAAIYGLENADGVKALVMELVEGEDLRQRLMRGAIPLDEALHIAKQIAEALEAAHEQGIIHRDLKPANIKLRSDGTVKVLDFGLAKALEPAGVSSSVSQSPTITTPAMTQAGVIMGTAAYMSPEQAKGKPADRRSDLWAFGCVLYEMLTGSRVFEGEDVSDTLAAVLRGEPDWTRLPQETPSPVRRLLRHCLAKDPKGRIGDASIARIEIDDVQSAPQITGQGAHVDTRHRAHWARKAAYALVTLTVGGVLLWMLRPASVPSSRLARFPIPLPAGQQFSNPGHRPVALSPDGKVVVYAANLQLHKRPLDQLEAIPIRGTEGAGRSPFFSPDGQSIGFWQGQRFKKVSIADGAPVVLCSAKNPWGASWTAENTILYGEGPDGIWRVSSNSGTPENVVKVGANQWASGPQLLPGGRTILFTLTHTADDARQIVVESLDTGQRRVVVEEGADARYVPTGHLVYALGETLLAAPFDVQALAVTGKAVPLVEDVATSPDGVMSYFAVSDEGTLVYVPRDAVARFQPRTLVWVDRQRRETPINVPPRPYLRPRLSPDGTRIAVEIRDQENDIWVWDLAREVLTKLTYGPALDTQPIWTHDGQSVIFSSGTAIGARNLFRVAADGTGTTDQLTHGTADVIANAVTPDGKGLIFQEVRLVGGGTSVDRSDLMLLPLVGEHRPQPLLQRPFGEANAELSPDGRWLAYQSNESGRQEIYVRPFPNVETGKRTQVSTSGGQRPLWARNGRELFYVSTGGTLMSVPVTTAGPTFANEKPSNLFDHPSLSFVGPPGRAYDVSRDSRFLMTQESSAAGEQPQSARLVIVLNWFEELKTRVPTK
jgi:serine/threonine protein kinase/Tol biopolymer transport system component